MRRKHGTAVDPATGRRKDPPWKEQLRQRCVARAQEHRRQLLAKCRGAEPSSAEPMDTQALCREIVSAEMQRGVVDDNDDDEDGWGHLSHDAFIELMTATEQSLLQELRGDVASLGGGDEEAARLYEEYLQREEERMRALLKEEEEEPQGGVCGQVRVVNDQVFPARRGFA